MRNGDIGMNRRNDNATGSDGEESAAADEKTEKR